VSEFGAPITISGSSPRTIPGIATAAALAVSPFNPALRVILMTLSLIILFSVGIVACRQANDSDEHPKRAHVAVGPGAVRRGCYACLQ
jgi:hypothetical protein